MGSKESRYVHQAVREAIMKRNQVLKVSMPLFEGTIYRGSLVKQCTSFQCTNDPKTLCRAHSLLVCKQSRPAVPVTTTLLKIIKGTHVRNGIYVLPYMLHVMQAVCQSGSV